MVMIERTYRRQPTDDFLLSPSLITKKRRPASFYLGYDEEEEEEQLARKKIKWQQIRSMSTSFFGCFKPFTRFNELQIVLN